MRTSEGKFRCMTLVVVAMTFAASCGKEEVDQPREPMVRPVKLVTIAGAGAEQSSRYPAVIDADRLSELSFQVSGLLKELPIQEAQEVERGALIAKLDQRDFRSKVASARAKFDNAQKEYQRALRLAKERAISRSVLEQRKSKYDVAKAEFATAKKALSDTVLRAPFAGVIAQVPVKRLQNIQAGDLVAKLMRKGVFTATINLPASVIAQSPTRKDKGAYVILDAAPENRIEATFRDATLVADAASQTYAVTLSFKPPDHVIILPGMTATVERRWSSQNADAESNRASIPLTALMSDGTEQFVWVVNKETMTVSKRQVTIEEGIGGTVIVTEGLTPGETIAGAGATYLAEGMKVRPWTK